MLSIRQGKILSALIREYTQTAAPVSSTLLVEKYHLDYSSATIRNEMLVLEELGYLVKPHISAGRIPSDKGYRYFVDNLMEERELSREYQKRLELELLKSKAHNARMTRTVAKMLSYMSESMAISGLIGKDEYFDFGIAELLDDPEFTHMDEVARIAAALDMIDENVDTILSKIKGDKTEIFIGKENPLPAIQNCSMVVSPYKLPNGERGIVAIIGPKRMKYNRNKSLIDFVKKILGSDKTTLMLIVIGSGAWILR